MRALLVAGLLVMASRVETRADCYAIGWWQPGGATLRGRITKLEWGAPIVVKCPDGKAHCLEAIFMMSDEPAHVRIVVENAVHRDRGATYKLKRVVLEGVMPQRMAECASAPIAVGQIRELAVEARTSAPWRVTSAR
jgi:hypothetical protein